MVHTTLRCDGLKKLNSSSRLASIFSTPLFPTPQDVPVNFIEHWVFSQVGVTTQ